MLKKIFCQILATCWTKESLEELRRAIRESGRNKGVDHYNWHLCLIRFQVFHFEPVLASPNYLLGSSFSAFQAGISISSEKSRKNPWTFYINWHTPWKKIKTKDPCIAFFNLENSIDHDLLLYCLLETSISGRMIPLIEIHLQTRELSIRVNDIRGISFNQSVDVPQGVVLSPL